ncbi:MAG TPA: class I SAM-dependent methyltransferase, partial [Polyangiaceae bacterium]|nr:class I SAM-dependent methyltransferase [Polyangiaceae bacterium]
LVQGFEPREYLRMLRHNTPMRVAKTLARQCLGISSRQSATLARDLGVARLPKLSLLRQSATAMTFPDETFDFVYSHSVFEHIDDPEAALREVNRVLRPGGVAYISVHLYTSYNGSHDPQVLADGCPVEPLWRHLRPSLRDTIHPNAYLNKLSLSAWRSLFETIFPGGHLLTEPMLENVKDELRILREQGELFEYTDEELLTVNCIGIWRKPSLGSGLR